MENKHKIYIIEFIVLLVVIFLINYYSITYYRISYDFKAKSKKLYNISIDISGASSSNRGGPYAFVRAINEVLPYNNSDCTFIGSKGIDLMDENVDYFYMSAAFVSEETYEEWVNTTHINKLIIGPNFIPTRRNGFPNKNVWKERRFPEILKELKGYAAHTDSIIDFIAENTNTTSMYDKYLKIRPCTNFAADEVNSFDSRTNDIIFFEKYADTDRSEQGKKFYEYLKSTNKNIESLVYGNYTKEQMIEYAKNSKFVIYFSFYDTGAIGLKEIQNYGVYAFTHQKEFVTDNYTTSYIPELDSEDIKPAFDKIMEKIDLLTKEKPDSLKIADINYNTNKCQMALEDLCEFIKNSKD